MARILIAEDEALLAVEIREELMRLWPEAEVLPLAHDGHEALRLLDRERPEVCFLDVQMPGLTGLEVARLAGGRAHVVFLTAFDQYAIQAFDEGAVGYLLKPLDRARLARTVQRVKERLSSPPANLAGLVTRLQGGQAVGPLRWITVQRGRELQLITVDDVCYFRADHKYVAVVTAPQRGADLDAAQGACAAARRRIVLAGAPQQHRQCACHQGGGAFADRQARHPAQAALRNP
jgi:DNA-binding LytR/AlgR family response regulator